MLRRRGMPCVCRVTYHGLCSSPRRMQGEPPGTRKACRYGNYRARSICRNSFNVLSKPVFGNLIAGTPGALLNGPAFTAALNLTVSPFAIFRQNCSVRYGNLRSSKITSSLSWLVVAPTICRYAYISCMSLWIRGVKALTSLLKTATHCVVAKI